MTDTDRTDDKKPSWRKGYARQQCVYKRPYGRNLRSDGNPTLEPNITSIANHLRSYGQFIYPRWLSDAILDFIEPEIASFDPPTLKTHMD